ncbi:MAG: YhcH/YjgK/YiaL family protein [Hydrogenoanaerobacterium sp.]
MIIDKISCAERYTGTIKNLSNALAFLVGKAELPEGRYEFNGGFIISTSGTTTPLLGKSFEAHKKYADVMFVLSGAEEVSFCDISSLNVAKPYDSDADVAFYDGENCDCVVNVQAGSFYALLPNEGHKPCSHTAKAASYKKYIIKCEQ